MTPGKEQFLKDLPEASRTLMGYAVRRFGTRRGEDLAQETLLKAWAYADQYRGKTLFGWLKYLMAHTVCDEARRTLGRAGQKFSVQSPLSLDEYLEGHPRCDVAEPRVSQFGDHAADDVETAERIKELVRTRLRAKPREAFQRMLDGEKPRGERDRQRLKMGAHQVRRWLGIAAMLLFVLCAGGGVAGADIWRWDNQQLIPGTAGVWPGPGVSLGGMNLQFADLAGEDLAGVNFAGADLASADLWGANVSSANFAGSAVDGAAFYGTGLTALQLCSTASYQGGDLVGMVFGQDGGPPFLDMREEDFAGCDLTGTVFWNVDLSGADFAGANVTGTYFLTDLMTGADFTGAIDSTTFPATPLPELASILWLAPFFILGMRR